ncbi:phosphoribosylaminoimidazole carboxylase ATPase subunit [Plesiomonas shigelloides 302-73]|uniref:Phosphoribosylaminoimidazole carboxylase ATPase subunit n=1 Tax=Plesiomonas shigelloides 302-73 TaxID=1315976 RepID=R8AVK8_PLESH|nr:phosphoribosylaminoimidazole carboxylase ATPase subunit [Plesiomonas shigelloides 302-73]
MKPVWVLGNGQLGNMLQQAAAPLAISVNRAGLMTPHRSCQTTR